MSIDYKLSNSVKDYPIGTICYISFPQGRAILVKYSNAVMTKLRDGPEPYCLPWSDKHVGEVSKLYSTHYLFEVKDIDEILDKIEDS